MFWLLFAEEVVLEAELPELLLLVSFLASVVLPVSSVSSFSLSDFSDSFSFSDSSFLESSFLSFAEAVISVSVFASELLPVVLSFLPHAVSRQTDRHRAKSILAIFFTFFFIVSFSLS